MAELTAALEQKRVGPPDQYGQGNYLLSVFEFQTDDFVRPINRLTVRVESFLNQFSDFVAYAAKGSFDRVSMVWLAGGVEYISKLTNIPAGGDLATPDATDSMVNVVKFKEAKFIAKSNDAIFVCLCNAYPKLPFPQADIPRVEQNITLVTPYTVLADEIVLLPEMEKVKIDGVTATVPYAESGVLSVLTDTKIVIVSWAA